MVSIRKISRLGNVSIKSMLERLIVGLMLTMPGAAVSESVFHVGHSLVNQDMPTMLDRIAISKNKSHSRTVQNIPGAALAASWITCPGNPYVKCATEELLINPHDILIVTEAIPLLNYLTDYFPNDGIDADSYLYALQYYDLQQQTNPGGLVYLYETWHCLTSGTPQGCPFDSNDGNGWRQRLDDSYSDWLSVVDYVNTHKTSGPDMMLIPAGQGMAALNDAVEAGTVPGYSSIDQFFTDDIHLTDIGNYYVALIHYATIYGETPLGAAYELINDFGGAYDSPTAAQAERLQTIAWETVSEIMGISADELGVPIGSAGGSFMLFFFRSRKTISPS